MEQKKHLLVSKLETSDDVEKVKFNDELIRDTRNDYSEVNLPNSIGFKTDRYCAIRMQRW
jgi:hypothetical protein